MKSSVHESIPKRLHQLRVRRRGPQGFFFILSLMMLFLFQNCQQTRFHEASVVPKVVNLSSTSAQVQE